MVAAARPVITRLSGAWEQVDAAAANDPDFAPGGYSRSMVVIDAASSELSVYRGFGPPSAAPFMLVSGQFHVDFGREGSVIVSESRVRPTNFSSQPRTVEAEGGSFTIRPPASASGVFDWNSEQGSGTLLMGGKRYRRLSDEARDRVIRGEQPLAGDALDREIARTMPAAPPASGGSAAAASNANVDFFGMQVRGRFVAFVIDCSGSMNEHGKMATALDELRRTINALPKDANVYVVFFSGGALEVPGFRGWVAAQSPRCGKLVAALAGVSAGGGTLPAPALERAFALAPRPDEVFLMTDGNMSGDPRDVIARLQSASKAKTTVHAIAFGADANQPELQSIAAENGGSFRFVP